MQKRRAGGASSNAWAVVTLTVPGSESINIVERQLGAMRAIEAPHDNWILVDKVHSPEIQHLAERLGVRYFSRHDVATWGEDKGRVLEPAVRAIPAEDEGG